MMRPATVPGKAPRNGAYSAVRSGPDLSHERRLWRAGHQVVAGMDEVGRGAWAGPLTVGVAVVKRGVRKFPEGLRDSKQLTELVRESLYGPLARWCFAWGVGHSSPVECDTLGMTRALRLAARRAFAELPPDAFPDAVLLDGKFNFISVKPVTQEQFDFCGASPSIDDLLDVRMPDGRCPEVKTVVKGDDACASVAAASVLAKVTRDRLMRGDAHCYPPFDFESNKGYPSPSHKCALRGYGLTAIHRRTWAFVDWLPVRRQWAPQTVEPAEMASGPTGQ